MVFLKPSVLRVQMHANKAKILSPGYLHNAHYQSLLWEERKAQVLEDVEDFPPAEWSVTEEDWMKELLQEEAAAKELNGMSDDHEGGNNIPPDFDDEIEKVENHGSQLHEEKLEIKQVKSEKSSRAVQENSSNESENQTCPACNKILKNVIQHINRSKKCQAKISEKELENFRITQKERKKTKNREKNAKFRAKQNEEERKSQNREDKANSRKRKEDDERKSQNKKDVENFRKRKLDTENGEDTKRRKSEQNEQKGRSRQD